MLHKILELIPMATKVLNAKPMPKFRRFAVNTNFVVGWPTLD